MKNNNIILIGFMGSGKTSVGKQLARILDYNFNDTDQIIEKECKTSISDIFANEGEEYFRKLETSIIQDLYGNLNNTVLSVGGGLPIREGNAELLQRLGHVIYLKASAQAILMRLAGDTTRPLLAGDDKFQKVQDLLQLRQPIYEKAAHCIIETDDKSIIEIVNEICKYNREWQAVI